MGDAARIAVTGVNGFVGRHLAAELTDHAIEVVGIGIEDRAAVDLDTYAQADLVAGWPEIGPVDAVIHLAGLAAVGPSFDDPQRYLTVNSSIVTHVAEALLGTPARLILVSSGAIYDGLQPLPLGEDSAIALSSPYAVSKVLNENQAAYYSGRGLQCVVARPFNHIGPGQGPGFLLPDLAALLDSASPGDGPIRTGNLASRRDYSDVRDVARAYRLLATQPHLSHAVYNICSGVSLSGEDILAVLAKAVGRDTVRTETDPARLRPSDPAEIVGDNTRLREDTGWAPRFSIEETVADFLKAR